MLLHLQHKLAINVYKVYFRRRVNVKLADRRLCFVTEGKPDPPQNLSTTGLTESTVGLKWEPPELDGGSPITGYVVEMRPTSKKAWTKVEDTKSLELTASKLSEGTEYLFRVAAQNAVGIGDFAELEKGVIPKGQFGE